MAKFHNPIDTKKVGRKITQLRTSAGFSISDIAEKTEFAYQTISNIEAGEETTLSYLIEIAKAIGVHPEEFFNGIKFSKQTRSKLNPKRKEKERITLRLQELSKHTDYFKVPRYVRDVVSYFKENFKQAPSSITVSVVLNRFVKDGVLKYNLVGRQKKYYK